ncbi:zinc carboxypeptidase [Cooperia oncophora]
MDTFLKMLRRRGVTQVETLKKDISRDIRRERRDLERSSRRKKRSSDFMDFDAENYHSYDEMVDFMKLVAEQKTDLVTLLNISKTFEGRTMYGVKISSSNEFKPAIFVDAGIHAREWIAPAVALYMIKRLVTGYGTDPTITRSVDKFDWYIVPEANPDGYEYSRISEPNSGVRRVRATFTVNKWCVGADANRNWGHRWGEAGANRSPCSNIYAGSRPFSEPEIVGLRDLVTWQIPNLVIYGQPSNGPLTDNYYCRHGVIHKHDLTTTSISETQHELLSQRYRTLPEQPTIMARLPNSCVSLLVDLSIFQSLTTGISDPASGTSIDYMQDRGVPYIFGVELRPLDSHNSYAFSLPPSYIRPTGEEMIAALIAIGDYAIEHKKI